MHDQKPKLIMKRRIYLPVLIFLFALSANAQSVNYGLSLGANLTSIKGNGINGSYYAGFIAGAFARKDLNEKWNVQPEILFNYANSKKADNFLNYYNYSGYANANAQIRLNYVSVPILFGYKLNKLFTINAGPQYSFLVYDDENLVIANKAVAFKRNDLGLVAGLQLKVENIRFFANYVFGVVNVNNIDNRYRWYNRQVTAGMNFNLF